MRRICVLGNSHVAALKMGLDLWLEEHPVPESSIDIFGFRRRNSGRLQVHQGCVQPDRGHPGAGFDFHTGPAVLRLDAYDQVYVTVGTRPDSFPHFNPRFVLNFVHPEHAIAPRSPAVVSRIVEHTVFEQWFSPLLQEMIRDSSRPVIHFLGCPFWSTRDPRARALRARLETDEEAREALDRLHQQVDTAVKNLETDRLRLPAPPSNTLDRYRAFTEHAFSAESKRMTADFEKGHGPRDFRHMNADYGRELVRSVFRGADSMTSSASSRARGVGEAPRNRLGVDG